MASSDPQPKTNVNEGFRKQIERLRLHSEKEDKAIRNEAPPEWYRPDELTTNLFDLEAISEPYSREAEEDQFAQVVKDASEPGTVGDLSMIVLQGDFLATLERAYRDRNMSSVRRRVQASARRMGHSAETGVIALGLLGYVERIDEFNKAEFGAEAPASDDVLGNVPDAGGLA